LPRPRLGVCVLRPEPYTAGGRVKLEQRGDDVAAVAARAVVHDRLEHQAELVEHVELDWLTLERVCDRGAGRDPAPPEELIDPGGDGELVDRFSRVILPRTGRREADQVEVGPKPRGALVAPAGERGDEGRSRSEG